VAGKNVSEMTYYVSSRM